MSLGPTTDYILDMCIKEVNKKKTKEKIFKHIVDPLFLELSTRYYPYFVSIITTLIIIIILLGLILTMMVLDKKN
jgi:hypothetical protein